MLRKKTDIFRLHLIRFQTFNETMQKLQQHIYGGLLFLSFGYRQALDTIHGMLTVYVLLIMNTLVLLYEIIC